MDFIGLLRKRRSIRKFQNRGLEPEKLDLLKEALLRSPSSRGINPWEFIFVTDENMLRSLAEGKAHGAEFLQGAALGVVVCGLTEKSDVWIEDCSIAAIIVQLAAEDLGLGSCWAQIRNRKRADGGGSSAYIRELLGIPPDVEVECVIGIGYPAEKPRPHRAESLERGKIFEECRGPARPKS